MASFTQARIPRIVHRLFGVPDQDHDGIGRRQPRPGPEGPSEEEGREHAPGEGLGGRGTHEKKGLAVLPFQHAVGTALSMGAPSEA